MTKMYATDAARWAALQIRDRAASNAFIYAVTTTRIYCRPDCPARLARRANVRFYDDRESAIAAGYRACKRCKPDRQSSSTTSPGSQVDGHDLSDSKQKAVDIACEYMRVKCGAVTLLDLSKHVGLSPRYLHHVFSTTVGCTPAIYASRLRSQLQAGGNGGEKELAAALIGSTVPSTATPGGSWSPPSILETPVDSTYDLFDLPLDMGLLEGAKPLNQGDFTADFDFDFDMYCTAEAYDQFPEAWDMLPDLGVGLEHNSPDNGILTEICNRAADMA